MRADARLFNNSKEKLPECRLVRGLAAAPHRNALERE
jgi:hypothetical protein